MPHPLVAPVLVLMAAAAIAEGYGWLGVLRLSGREPSAVVFAALALVLTAVLVRRRGGYRVAGAEFLVGTGLILLAATLSSLLVAGSIDDHIVGASALAFGAVALGAAGVDEHRSRQGARAERAARPVIRSAPGPMGRPHVSSPIRRNPDASSPIRRNVLQ